MLPKRPGWTACIIGQTTPAYQDFQLRLEQKVATAGLKERVQFVGKVKNFDDIPQWYQAMSIVAVPSRVEGFGLTCLEAMASGCAVVATQTGAFPEIIQEGENGWLVSCEDTRALTVRLLKITQNPSKIASIGELARKRVLASYTIEKTAEKTAKFYEKIISTM